MLIKNLLDEDFVNYSKPSMFIGFNSCTFKCDKECGKPVCQNSELAKAPSIEVDPSEIVKRYMSNPITEAVVCGGLEPFDTFEDLIGLVSLFRQYTQDDIVIYTGYYPNEIAPRLQELTKYNNIVIKFGRFIPNKLHKYDEILGIELSSDNQYAKRLEDC